MGVRLREELRQVLDLNNSGSDKRLGHVRELKENNQKNFVYEKNGESKSG